MELSRRSTWLLLAPTLVVMGMVFILPLISFLVGSVTEIGDLHAVGEQVMTVLGSRTIRQSLEITFSISLMTTVSTLAIGYPLAYAMSCARGLAFRIIGASVILPYFTSIIVRTYAWMVLLGRAGLINQVLLRLHLVDAPLALMYNRTGVVIGMTYVLLPYMVLTLYATMKGIDSSLLRAAEGMGASRLAVFGRVFLPLTMRGVLAGVLIVFILAIGFFITPELMGGPRDLMIGMLIERQIELGNDWPLAAIMSLVLLMLTLALYAMYSRFADIRRMLAP